MTRILTSSVQLLDGGTGKELFKLGLPYDKTKWSALALTDQKYHSLVIDVHQSYITAGASFITTNNYTVTPHMGFVDNQDLVKYTKIAGQLAQKAIETHPSKGNVKILGSLPPLIESYRPDLVLKDKQFGSDIYRLIIQTLVPYVDILLAETMSSLEETMMILPNMKGLNIPLYIAFTLDSNGDLRSGESVQKVLHFLLDQNCENLSGILFNCCEPESITIALEFIHSDALLIDRLKKKNILLGCYPNRFVAIDKDWSIGGDDRIPEREDFDSNSYVKTWVDMGVTLIGGCCGIGPADIKMMHAILNTT
ncbi:hypothetical protein HDV02_005750 [Globomyces sp. JEL0801]|nr:hypothetical protein HDV02_005750 [Globomyces sp. JEL0801]